MSRLRYAVEPEPLDTAGAIRFAADFTGIDDTFVVANGDVLTDLDIGLVDFHRRHAPRRPSTSSVSTTRRAFGVVATDEHGRVEQFVEKPAPGTAPSNQINAGTYVLEPSVLQRIPPGRKVSIERVMFPQVVADGGLFAMATDDYWIDAGSPLLVPAGQSRPARRHAPRPRLRRDSPRCRCRPDGDRRRQHRRRRRHRWAHATVTDSVVLPGAVVGQRAVVANSVIMGKIGEDASVTDSVLGLHGRVDAGEVVSGEFRPPADQT